MYIVGSVENALVQCITCLYFCLGFWYERLRYTYKKTMKFMSSTCECTHGEQGVDCEFVMVVGVGRGTSVL